MLRRVGGCSSGGNHYDVIGPGVDLDGISEARLERLHAGLVKLALMDDTALAALVEQVLSDDELASSS